MKYSFMFERLEDFPEWLEQCNSEDWDLAIKYLIWQLLSELIRDVEMSKERKQWLERLFTSLKRGPTSRNVGRPREDEQAKLDAILFSLLKIQTIAEGVEALRRGPKLKKHLRVIYPWLSLSSSLDRFYPDSLDPSYASEDKTTVVLKDAALRQRAARAARAGYQFEKDARFGKRRKKP